MRVHWSHLQKIGIHRRRDIRRHRREALGGIVVLRTLKVHLRLEQLERRVELTASERNKLEKVRLGNGTQIRERNDAAVLDV